MADEKTIYRMKTPSGDPVRVEEAWKDANGELLTEKVNKADAQTITGLKTFSTLPQSSATPSDDKDLATKKYSDDLWATRKAQEEKCYQALKTVTKDFTRTDPVYVRIGDDGEPEIHYTIAEKKSGAAMFIGYNLDNCTFYLHGGANLTSAFAMFQGAGLKRIIVDSFANCDSVAQSLCHLGSSAREGLTKEIKVLDPTLNYGKEYGFSYIFFGQVAITELPMLDFSKMSGNQSEPFANCLKVKVMPAYDFTNVTKITNFTYRMFALERIEATGIKWSFDISSTAMAHDGILYLFQNGLSTVSKDDGITLTLGSGKLALMSDEEKAIATGKGWVLA